MFFLNRQPFCGNYLTLDSHTNTAISHAIAYSSRWLPKPLQGLLYKSKTYTRFILSFLAQIFLSFSFFLNNLMYQSFFNLQYFQFEFSFMVYLVNRLFSTTGLRNSCLFSVTTPPPPRPRPNRC